MQTYSVIRTSPGIEPIRLPSSVKPMVSVGEAYVDMDDLGLSLLPDCPPDYSGDLLVSLERRDGSGRTRPDSGSLEAMRKARDLRPKARLWAGIIPVHSWAVMGESKEWEDIRNAQLRAASQSSDQTMYNLCAATGGGVAAECFLGDYAADNASAMTYAARVAGWTKGAAGVPVLLYTCWRKLAPMYEHPDASPPPRAVYIETGAAYAGAAGIVQWDYLTTQADRDACQASLDAQYPEPTA